MILKGKVVIVTGGARDIGREVSLKLARSGARIAINYFDNPEGRRRNPQTGRGPWR